jgi:putative ABC transport system permease protein
MRHWSQLAIRNWRAKPGRTILATLAIALGVGVVIWVTGIYESIRQSVATQVWTWLGKSHLSVESTYGRYGTVYESIVDDVLRLPNVAYASGTLKERVEAVLSDAADASLAETTYVDAIGIRPEQEKPFRDYSEELAEGRVLRAGDAGVVVVERPFAEDHGIRVGGTLRLRRDAGSPARGFEVVGLVDYRRVERFQRPMVLMMLKDLQALVPRAGPARVTKVDIILKETKKLPLTGLKVRAIVDRFRQGFVVNTAEAKLRQVETAQRQTQFVLTLISGVALFTAFFIILSTLSMGMVERIGQLGLLRCVGMTRGQLFGMVVGEVVPVGAVGVALGVPIGIGLMGLSVLIVPQYVGQVVISSWGLVLALVGGAVTAIGGGILPALQAMRVSPLDASRPRSHPERPWLDIAAAVLGLGLIGAHVWMMQRLEPMRWLAPPVALAGVMFLYCGYALLTPGLVRFGGAALVRAAAVGLGVRYRLLRDQVGRASWRSAGICSGLMVGLSLIVCLVVHSRSIAAGWDFPKRMCEAFVWPGRPVSRSVAREAADIPGVALYTLVNDVHCSLGWFAAGEPDSFFKMAKLEFIEGDKAEAIAKLNRGGYILVPPQFAQVRNVKLGSKILIRAGRGGTSFEVAGIVESPALDIAATYMNAESDLVQAQVNGVLGTLEDARRYFGIGDEITLFLLNFDIVDTPPPRMFREDALPTLTRPSYLVRWMEDWREAMPERQAEIDRVFTTWGALGEATDDVLWTRLPAGLEALQTFRSALVFRMKDKWGKLTPAARWRKFREEVVLGMIAERVGVPHAFRQSVAELKAEIDRTLETATYLMTAIPAVALIVAALGVANLMTANVASRSRELAVLRAVGATKSQVTRLVIGEAVVLGATGTLLGLLLGLQAAHGVNTLTYRIWLFPMKFALPWRFTLGAMALTVGVCLIAGVLPARRAARSNIIDALQTA